MPLLNPYLRAFFRSTIPAQCIPVQEYIIIVPTTEILMNSRDRETGSLYADLAGTEEFLSSHVLRVPSPPIGSPCTVGRENRGKARQFTTLNGRTVVVKDSWVYSNKGFRNLNQAQLLNDILYYPDGTEPQQWLIYYITKPLIGSIEYVSTIPPYFRERSRHESPESKSIVLSSVKKDIKSFNELLMLFPMIARQMQAGLEKLFRDFEVSFEEFKPLPLPPSSMSTRSGTSAFSVRSDRSSIGGDLYRQAADESAIRKSLELAITVAVDLFQRVDQSQLDLLATTTDLTGPMVDHMIEWYVTEQLHDTTLFPKLCATKAIEDEELEQRIFEMQYVDLTQIGIPFMNQQDKSCLTKRISHGITCFRKISRLKSPQAMAENLLATARILTSLDESVPQSKLDRSNIEKHTSSVVTMNADMLVSLLLIVVIRAKVPHLHACLSYMRNFVFMEDVEKGEIGYVLSTLEAVLFHIAQDHVLIAASSKNQKLWQDVKRGKIRDVKMSLEQGIEIFEKDVLSISSGSKVEKSSNICQSDDHNDAHVVNGVIKMSDGAVSYDSGIELPHLHVKKTSSILKGAQYRKRLGSGVFQEIPNGSVHISNAPPINIHNLDCVEEDYPGKVESSTNEGQFVKDELLLTKEGPPVGDIFDMPTSPTTGVTNIPMKDLQANLSSDYETINNIRANTTSSRQQSTSNNKPGDTVGILRKQLSVRFSHLEVKSGCEKSVKIDDYTNHSTINGACKRHNHNDGFAVEQLSRTRNEDGESIIMMAVQERQLQTLQYLLNSSLFDLKYILDDERDDGTTLLSAAVQTGDMRCVDLVLKELSCLSVDNLKNYLNKSDTAGRTVAHHLFNAPDLIARIGRYLPWHAKDKNGQTPLFAMCRSYDHHRYREMVGMAIREAQGSQMDSAKLRLDDHIDSKGNSLLHVANDAAVVRLLLRCDTNVNSTNDKGFTPLMVASKYGRVEIVKCLFGDQRVDVLAKELRGLTAVELAKDDDIRNRIDDLVLFQNAPANDSRVTAVVRSFFVEDGTIRVVLKSGAPSIDESSTFTVTTCRRSLSDFQFLEKWLQYENPASWLPSFHISRSPYQIPSKPSRAILRDLQLRVDNFLRTLLSHSTFSTHELLWEFFLVPEMQEESLIERSKNKSDSRIETVREEFVPVEDVREVDMFVSVAKDSVQSINFACRSVTRTVAAIRTIVADLPDIYNNVIHHLKGFEDLEKSRQLSGLARFTEALVMNESHPYALFIEDLRNVLSSLSGVTVALERPRLIINEITAIQKQIDRHLLSLRRSDRWPLGLLDDTRAKYHSEAAQKAQARNCDRINLACELRYTQSIAAQELAGFHEMHTKQVTFAIRSLARRQVVVQKDHLASMQRAIRTMKSI